MNWCMNSIFGQIKKSAGLPLGGAIHGTINSTIMIFSPPGDDMMMSGFRVVDNTTSGKWSFLPRSTSISHPWADYRRFCLAWLWTIGLWPSFTKAMLLNSGLSLASCFFLLSCSRMSASSANTLSWHDLYLPYVKVVLQPDRMWAIVLFPPHNLHSGPSLIPHLCKLTGVCKVS